eukprot:TRINITY_DN426_c0_g1_i1.p1 TRINITY_DN426_c0_g1~~TRINITY_DN426_c0_g1_i1.p1  ORF type:complete len:402 (+),score=60.18 TRINITY_DN426_c0_g1_i1:86-1291(+)
MRVSTDEIIVQNFSSRSRRKIIISLFITLLLIAVIVLGLLLFFSLTRDGAGPEDPLERALWLHGRYPLIDTHNDLPYMIRNLFNKSVSNHNISIEQNITDTDIPKLRASKFGAQFWSVYVTCGGDAIKRTLEQIDIVYQLINEYPNDFELVINSKDITKVWKKRKIGSLIGVEGGHQINSSLAALNMYYKLGARYMTLTHNCNTPWAEAALPTDADSYPGTIGLTDFGREVVLEMNRLGMMVDISHVALQTMHDVLDTTLAPVIFSHSATRYITDHPRNVPDDVLLRLRDNGGVIMILFIPAGVSRNISWTADVNDVADHIDHVRDLIGVDYIGYGSDFDAAVPAYPVGLENTSKYPNLTAELIRRGYSDSDIAKIIGGNIIRVFAEVERIAKELRSLTTD